jgi:hypothetical protein
MTETGKFVGPCYHCKTQMWLPDDLYTAAKHSEKIAFYCPYGHPQIFAKGDSETTILRRERDLLAQRIAMKDDQIAELVKQREAARATAAASARVTRKMTVRAAAGVCPCCKRTVSQMKRHMQSKHPNFITAQEVH